MQLLQKSYRKTWLYLLSALLGLFISAKESCAVANKPFARITKCVNHTCVSGNIYARHLLPIRQARYVWSSRCRYLAGYCGGKSNARMLLWPYMSSGAFTTQCFPTAYYLHVCLDRAGRSVVVPKKLNFEIAPIKGRFFVDRPQATASLAPYFDSTDKFVIFPPITGVAGLGKTQLVHQLIGQHISKYDHIVWINAATKKDIKASYLQIAKEIAILEPFNNSAAQLVNLVQNRLEDKHVLYVFDDAPELKTIQGYLKNGHILITSTNSTPTDWTSSHYDAPLDLAPFGREDVLQLAKAMKQDSEDPSLIALIQLLPKAPLVMVQLLSVMSARKDFLQIFLHELKQNSELIQQLKEKPETYKTAQDVLSEIIKSTLEALQSRADGEALLQMVQQLTCLDAKPISLNFVFRTLGQEQTHTQDILLALARNGLIKWDAHNIYMHEVIQTIIGKLYPPTAAQVKKLAEGYLGYTTDVVGAVSAAKAHLRFQMIPHGEKLLKHLQERGEEHYTAKCYFQLSYLYCQQENYHNALTYGEKALELFLQIHKQNSVHPSIANVAHTLGDAYYGKRLYVKSLTFYEKALNIRQKVYGKTPHPDIASAYNSLGSAYFQQRHYHTAFNCYEKALNMYTAVYGDMSHPDIASTYHHLSNTCARQGEASKAVDFYEQSSNMYKEVYGYVPYRYLVSYYDNLGESAYAQGQYDTSIGCHEKCLEMYKEIYSDLPHPDIAFCYHNLGNAYGGKRMYDKAFLFCDKAFDMFVAIYGDIAHPDIALSYHKIGNIYYQQKLYDEALDLYEQSLDMYVAVYGDKPHQNIVALYHSLGNVYFRQGQHKQGLECHERLIDMCKALYGHIPRHYVASYYNSLGEAYYDEKQYTKAVECHQKSLGLYKSMYGQAPHPDISCTYSHLGNAFYKQGLYEQAIECYQKSLDIDQNIYGDTPYPGIASSYHNLWVTYFCQARVLKAFAYWRKGKAVEARY